MTRTSLGRRTKSVEQSIEDTDEPGTRLRKDLTWWDLIVFGVSVVIGAGIFTITASTAGNITGPAISISFVLAAIACGLAALCYAEFASTVPVAGSAYTFSYASFGEVVAWIIGWDLVLEFAVGAATVAKSWSTYLGEVFGFAGGEIALGPLSVDWGAVVIVAIVTTLLALGTKLSSNVSAVITLVKVAVVLVVICVGAFYIKAANYSPYIPPAEPGGGSGEQSLFSLLTGAGSSNYGWYGLLAGASVVFFAFIGFDVVATTAEETKDPQKDVPRGIFGTLAIVTVLYVAVAVVLSGMVKYTELAKAGEDANLATAFKLNGIDWAATLISIGALAGLTTVVMVLILGQIRVLFAMSRDRLLPHQLAQTGEHGTPVRLTIIVGVRRRRRGRAVPDHQTRRDGQRRHPVRLRAGVGGRDHPAPDPPGPAPRLPGAAGAVAADRRDRRVSVADAEPDGADLDPLPCLDGDRDGRLLPLRPQTLGAGAAGGRRGFGALIHRERRKARPIRG